MGGNGCACAGIHSCTVLHVCRGGCSGTLSIHQGCIRCYNAAWQGANELSSQSHAPVYDVSQGDHICIMSAGKEVAAGTSLHLKNTFGGGYQVKLVTPQHNVAQLKAVVQQRLPAAKLVDDSAGSLSYAVPLRAVAQVPPFFEWVEDQQQRGDDSLFTDWGLSHTTLEVLPRFRGCSSPRLQLTRRTVPRRKCSFDLLVRSGQTTAMARHAAWRQLPPRALGACLWPRALVLLLGV